MKHFKKLTGKRKLNNHGSAMVLVIMTIAFLTILGAMLILMSYINFEMKATERRAKANFYTAESVLDQINAGLQGEMSSSMAYAYVLAMQQYGSLSEEYRNQNFTFCYLSDIKQALRTAASESKYQIEAVDRGDGTQKGLKSYLDQTLTEAVADGRLEISSEANELQILTTGVVLRGVHIAYTDTDGYLSEIDTDIRLNLPDINFATASALPNLFEYSLVADTAIEANNTQGVNVQNNLYAGSGGIRITGDSQITIQNAPFVVSKGDMTVGQTASLTVREDVSVWTEGIEVTSAILKLLGSCYVRDDLTLTGANSDVTLSGSYTGYSGDSPDAADSSAIILNGKDSKLDMSGLEELLLSGNAYIQTSVIAYGDSGGSTSASDILMGGSLSVKSDQIVYLVPAECIGVNGEITLVGKNPMTAAEYAKWKEFEAKRLEPESEYANYRMVDLDKLTNLLNKKLSSYSLEKPDRGYTEVFRTVHGETLCYLYLAFTPEGAADYYRDYYAAAMDRMTGYAEKYENEIIIGSSMRRQTTSGNLLSYTLDSGGTVQLLENTLNSDTTDGERAVLAKETDNYAEMFKALCSKLTVNHNEVSEAESTRGVYENFINEAAVNALTPDVPQEYDVKISNAFTAKAVVINNQSTVYRCTDPSIRLIIASGDVEVYSDFEGLIIARGTVHITSSVLSIKGNKEDVTKALQTKISDDADAKSVIETYFIDGDRYFFLPSDSAAGTPGSGYMNLEELIVYENWRKM